ncbi:MOSC domain-containing protein [Marinobacteraceae bacterium S3BR75-40.1]
MHVVSLFRYPVKSMPGHPVNTLPLDELGPQGDRRWMLVDEQGRFMTQRQWPQLSQLKVSVREGAPGVSVRLPDGREGQVDVTGEKTPVTVWRDEVLATQGAGDAAGLLSDWLGQSVRLVYMGEDDERQVDPARVEEPRRVGFADGFPFLVVNLASLRQLEAWTGRRLDVRRFRPNIVVDTDEPFAEDAWCELSVGNVLMRCVKPCSRCVMTTVDPDTGQPDPDKEPLRTLGRHRRTPDGVIFGQNAIHLNGREIRIGDAVKLA